MVYAPYPPTDGNNSRNLCTTQTFLGIKADNFIIILVSFLTIVFPHNYELCESTFSRERQLKKLMNPQRVMMLMRLIIYPVSETLKTLRNRVTVFII